jgi:hypothetical protein
VASWEAWVAENGIAVEEESTWEFGGRSAYFRDPDRHLIVIRSDSVLDRAVPARRLPNV